MCNRERPMNKTSLGSSRSLWVAIRKQMELCLPVRAFTAMHLAFHMFHNELMSSISILQCSALHHLPVLVAADGKPDLVACNLTQLGTKP